MQFINYIVIAIILIAVFAVLIIILQKNYNVNEILPEDVYSIDYLIQGIKSTFHSIIKVRIEELNLNKYEMEKRIRNKSKLRDSIRNCSCGDLGAKAYVKDYISDLLQRKFNINELTINNVIPFDDIKKMTVQDKFEIILFLNKKLYALKAFEHVVIHHKLDQLRYDEYDNPYYEIKETDINQIYDESYKEQKIGFIDKLDIVSQRIYQNYLGHGVIDELRDMKIDGVSAGVSGIPVDLYSYSEEMMKEDINKMAFSYDSIWCFFQGKLFYLSFLGFGKQKELERVCRNIYRYNSPGQLSEEKGHVENDMKDGSRIVVVRPPFSDSWALLVRKHNSIKTALVEEIITDQRKEIAIQTMKFLVKGCQVIAITGEQGCGKTTMLRSLIQYINPTYSLRIQELIFELSLRKLYPFRNILTFKELPNVSGQEGLDLQKKTDGAVNILGEVASSTVANWVIQMSQVASLFTMFTHHAKRTSDLISWMRNALLKDGGFSNERVAEEQVVNSINFDIHMGMTINGHRYIDRITEIIPIPINEKSEKDIIYQTEDIVLFQDGGYHLNHKISDRTKKAIFRYLTDKEKEDFSILFEGVMNE